jgi:hypothetical protein
MGSQSKFQGTVILGAIAGGVSLGVVLIFGWLLFRDNRSDAKKQSDEIAEQYRQTMEQHRRDGTVPLGESISRAGRSLLAAEEAEKAKKAQKPKDKGKGESKQKGGRTGEPRVEGDGNP